MNELMEKVIQTSRKRPLYRNEEEDSYSGMINYFFLPYEGSARPESLHPLDGAGPWIQFSARSG
jgi:hypothetical protein